MCVTVLYNVFSCPSHDDGGVLVVISAFLFAGCSSRCGHIPSLYRYGGVDDDDGGGDDDDGWVEQTPAPPAVVASVSGFQWTLVSPVWTVFWRCDCDGVDDDDDGDGGDDGVRSVWMKSAGFCDGFVGLCCRVFRQYSLLHHHLHLLLQSFLASEFGSVVVEDDDGVDSLHKNWSCRPLLDLLADHCRCPWVVCWSAALCRPQRLRSLRSVCPAVEWTVRHWEDEWTSSTAPDSRPCAHRRLPADSHPE